MRLTESYNLAADKIARIGIVAIEQAKAAGVCAYYKDPAYPGKIIREHPNGYRDMLVDSVNDIYGPLPPASNSSNAAIAISAVLRIEITSG